jgi:hypothetical protein
MRIATAKDFDPTLVETEVINIVSKPELRVAEDCLEARLIDDLPRYQYEPMTKEESKAWKELTQLKKARYQIEQKGLKQFKVQWQGIEFTVTPEALGCSCGKGLLCPRIKQKFVSYKPWKAGK